MNWNAHITNFKNLKNDGRRGWCRRVSTLEGMGGQQGEKGTAFVKVKTCTQSAKEKQAFLCETEDPRLGEDIHWHGKRLEEHGGT